MKLIPLMLALLLTGCARPLPLPHVAPPALATRTDAVPSLRTSTLSVPLRAPLDMLEALLREHVALPNLDDYQIVTEPGQSPEIGIRYSARLLAPQVEGAGESLRVTIPVAYHGAFRARVKTLFGWIWLTKGTDWGTPEAEGRITLVVDVTPSIARDWTLSTRSELRDVQLTAPPVEELCTRGAFKMCVPADWARARVHAELDRRVRDAAVRGLARVDEGVRVRVNLPGLASEVWQRLQRPAPLAQGELLRLTPARMILTPITVADGALAADLRVWCAPQSDANDRPAARPLPPPSSGAWLGDVAHLRARVPLPRLGAAFGASGAQPVALSDTLRAQAVAVLGAAPEPGRWLIALTLQDDDERTFTVYASAELHADGARLRLAALSFSHESAPLLAAARLDAARLGELVTQKLDADLRSELDAHAAALRDLLTDAVAPLPSRALPSASPHITAAYAIAEGIALDVDVR